MRPTRHALLALACLCFPAAIPIAARANQALDFEGLTTTSDPVPDQYGGLHWTNFDVLDTDFFRGSGDTPAFPAGYINGVVSPSSVAFDGYGEPALLFAAAPFRLVSGYLTGAYNDGLDVEVVGSLDGVTVYDRTFVVDATAPSFIAFAMPNVDRVVFTPTGGVHHPGYGNGPGTNFVLDDLDDLVVGAAAVPEPTSIALFAAGSVLSLGLRSRLNRRRSGL